MVDFKVIIHIHILIFIFILIIILNYIIISIAVVIIVVVKYILTKIMLHFNINLIISILRDFYLQLMVY